MNSLASFLLQRFFLYALTETYQARYLTSEIKNRISQRVFFRSSTEISEEREQEECTRKRSMQLILSVFNKIPFASASASCLSFRVDLSFSAQFVRCFRFIFIVCSYIPDRKCDLKILFSQRNGRIAS